MAQNPTDNSPGNGYAEYAAIRYDDAANTKPRNQWPDNHRRIFAPTIRIARIETSPMTPEEDSEAITALAVLLARFWTEHPDTIP